MFDLDSEAVKGFKTIQLSWIPRKSDASYLFFFADVNLRGRYRTVLLEPGRAWEGKEMIFQRINILLHFLEASDITGGKREFGKELPTPPQIGF